MNRLLNHLRRVFEEPLDDADLLVRFIERREDSAFSALVKRHGPMVLGVCRRILGNAHDAEDAFQATFLVLARRAAAVRPHEAVGAWLYGVAYRTALEARAKIARRCVREKQVEELPELEVREQPCCQELLSLLDREVHRLPIKYRLPVILCDLEGRSRKDVARQLSIPEGTLSSRLAAAHKKLAWRLTRLGLSFSGASLVMLLAEGAASASVPALLAVDTTRAALLVAAGQAAGLSAGVITLTEGVLQTMFIAKLKTATVVLCSVAALGLGTGGICYQTRVGAADSPRPGQQLVAGISDDDDASQEKERAKRATEEARLRASLRDDVEIARKKAQEQRDKAEAERRRAEEALRNLKEQLAKVREAERQAKEQARRVSSENDRQAQNVFSARQIGGQSQDRLKDREREIREQFKKARQSLMEQMKRLDEQERETLRKLVSERSQLSKQQSSEKATPGGDKLDRILERLDRMERRLEKLERSKQQ